MAHHDAQGSPLPLLLTASVGCAMTLVDTNVIAVTVPAMTRQLESDAIAGQWIISAFFLSFAATLLPAGAIADRLGRRRFFLLGLAGLALASLLCGLATTTLWLHLSRGLQGVMTAFVLAPALAIIGHRFHQPEERNRAWAIWGGVMGVTMVVAPVAGGLIVEILGWRWAFFVNIPICAALGLAARAFAEESRDDSRGRLDPAGILLFAAAMFGLTWWLISGQTQGWISPTALAGLAMGVLCMTAFVIVERAQTQPMLNLALFKSAPFVGAVWAMFAYAATAQVMASLLPIFLQQGGGLSAISTGLAMLPFAAAMLIFPYLGARLGRSLTSPAILTLGLSVVALGNAIAATGVMTGNWVILLSGLFIIGSGAGLLNGETQKAIMITLPRDQTGIASGISTTSRFSGILIGFAALNAAVAAAQSIVAAADDSGDAASMSISASGIHTIGLAAALLVAAVVAALSALLVRVLMQPRPAHGP
jgi:EmrB/QacA subfamily drug resistance transporter